MELSRVLKRVSGLDALDRMGLSRYMVLVMKFPWKEFKKPVAYRKTL